MRAAVITAPGGPDVLEVREVPDPVPAHGEVLVRVRASSLNRADLIQRRGGYPAPPGSPADIPGLEFAGEIAEIGDGVAGWEPGDRVFGIVGGGAHAELLAVPAPLLVRVPESLEWSVAGAVPEAFITAHDALVVQGRGRAADRVLVHAVGSGVGLAAVQIARLVGAVPYGTSRTADKLERAREHGMEAGIVPGSLDDIATASRGWTDGRGMDVVLDLVGGAYTAASLPGMAREGRLILIGLVAGTRAEVDLRSILNGRLTIRGTVLRSRPLHEKAGATRRFAEDLLAPLAEGRLAPVLDTTFPLDGIADAHRRMESNASFGKVVLTI